MRVEVEVEVVITTECTQYGTELGWRGCVRFVRREGRGGDWFGVVGEWVGGSVGEMRCDVM